jgi:hypothetical protein
MSQALHIEVSDEAFSEIRRQAESAGTSPAQLAAVMLEQQFGGPSSLEYAGSPEMEAGRRAARERFERHFGAVNLGYATGADNESIDADLARAYAETHEDG